MFPKIPLCLFNRHEPDRAKAVWTGEGYTSTCVHCGRPINRLAHRKWRKAA